LHAPPQPVPFQIVDQGSVAPTWNGARLVLQPNQNANMPQTTNGTMVFAYQNLSSENNQGVISITSGGSKPVFENVIAGLNQPSMLINSWQASNLSVTNVSPNDNTPIAIQAIGPGIPGTSPLPLPVGLPGVKLTAGQTAQGTALPQWMQLVLQCNASTTAIMALIGGPPDANGNNGYVIAVNYQYSSGPGTGKNPPTGYYATTTSNNFAFQLNWGSASLFVANMSSLNAYTVTVVLREL
jgi:hypothetical protein